MNNMENINDEEKYKIFEDKYKDKTITKTKKEDISEIMVKN